MFVRKSTYDRVVAQRDGHEIVIAHQHSTIRRLQTENRRLEEEAAKVSKRGPRGRFVPKGTEA